MELIFSYFPNLSTIQKEQISKLKDLYELWNSQINVISRKDMDAFYLHHVLHSLAIAKFIEFVPGTKVLDIGTGGGFPGIPLAILFPECEFTLVDSIGKKIKVVNEVAQAIGLTNIKTYHSRVEEVDGPFDFIVTRAVARVAELELWTKTKLAKQNRNAIKNGYLLLKGGDLFKEVNESKFNMWQIKDLSEWFKEPFFSENEKKLVYIS